MFPRRQTPPLTRRWLVTGACLIVSVVALLLWARLRLVTGIPRTAYAEPRAAHTNPAPPTGASEQPGVAVPGTR